MEVFRSVSFSSSGKVVVANATRKLQFNWLDCWAKSQPRRTCKSLEIKQHQPKLYSNIFQLKHYCLSLDFSAMHLHNKWFPRVMNSRLQQQLSSKETFVICDWDLVQDDEAKTFKAFGEVFGALVDEEESHRGNSWRGMLNRETKTRKVVSSQQFENPFSPLLLVDARVHISLLFFSSFGWNLIFTVEQEFKAKENVKKVLLFNHEVEKHCSTLSGSFYERRQGEISKKRSRVVGQLWDYSASEWLSPSQSSMRAEVTS